MQAEQVSRQAEQEVPVADREAEAGAGCCAEQPAVPLRVLPCLPGRLSPPRAGQPAISAAAEPRSGEPSGKLAFLSIACHQKPWR